MYSDSDLKSAASRAKWLIEKRQVKSNTAYIIACNTFKIPLFTGKNLVRKEYQKIKGIDKNQGKLF